MFGKILNSFGLVFDIIGAWFIANEVVNKFKGKQLLPTPTIMGKSPPPEKTREYKEWESNHFNRMKIGLCLITIGFILQGISSWLNYLTKLFFHK